MLLAVCTESPCAHLWQESYLVHCGQCRMLVQNMTFGWLSHHYFKSTVSPHRPYRSDDLTVVGIRKMVVWQSRPKIQVTHN
jgi:hypothetical protein